MVVHGINTLWPGFVAQYMYFLFVFFSVFFGFFSVFYLDLTGQYLFLETEGIFKIL